MFNQIVVGVDGREGGRDAVALAKLLVAAGGELTLAHVLPRDPHLDRIASAAYEAPRRSVLRRCLKRCARRRVSKRTCAGADLFRWDAACMSFANCSAPISWPWVHPAGATRAGAHRG